MNVKLIGTGAIYTRYASSCTLVNKNLIVDMPNGTLKQLLNMNIDPNDIDTIIITHMHGDHTADIPFFLKYIFNYIKRKKELKIIGPTGIKKKIIELFESYNFEDENEINEFFKIEYIEVDKNSTFLINNYKIESIKVLHGLEPAYGYIINDKLGLTGDSGLCDSVIYICKNAKLVVADSSLIEGDNTHMGINDIQEISEISNIVCTHLRDNTRQKLKNINIPNVIVEEDGFEIEI